MRFQSITIKSQKAQLVAAGIVVLLTLLLAVVQPSAWVYFAAIWLIPAGLGAANQLAKKGTEVQGVRNPDTP